MHQNTSVPARGACNASRPLAGFRGGTRRDGRGQKGVKGKERREGKRREWREVEV